MTETNEKVNNLNNYINRRAELLSLLKEKEDVKNITQNEDDNLVSDFESILNECIECDQKIKEYKLELEPRYFVKFDEQEYVQSSETGLVLQKENKIINWFKNKIKEFKFNYAIERSLKRDNFIEGNISNQISSYEAYLNVIKSNGNKAIFTKYINDIVEINNKISAENEV